MVHVDYGNGWSASYNVLANGIRVSIWFKDMIVRQDVLLSGTTDDVVKFYVDSLRGR